MLFWISVYVLIGSHKFFGKFLDFSWATGSYIGEDADLVCFFTLFKTFQRHSPSTFHLKAPLWIFKETSISLLLFLHQNQIFYPVTLFIDLIWFRSIILKFISALIYPLKAHSLDPSLKRFHKHFIRENLRSKMGLLRDVLQKYKIY